MANEDLSTARGRLRSLAETQATPDGSSLKFGESARTVPRRYGQADNPISGGRGFTARDRLRRKAASLPRLKVSRVNGRARPYARAEAQYDGSSGYTVETHVNDRG